MLKIFGLRVTPFFLFLLGLECLVLILSLYLGVLLYQGASLNLSIEYFDHAIYSGVFLMILISILTPGFFSQIRMINRIRNSVNELLPGIIVSVLTMALIILINYSVLNSKILFLAALFSACVGMIVNQFSILSKYWKFLIRTGVN